MTFDPTVSYKRGFDDGFNFRKPVYSEPDGTFINMDYREGYAVGECAAESRLDYSQRKQEAA